MNAAAHHHDPDRYAAQQAAARRFGIAIVTSSLVVALLAFVVYVRTPGGTLQPYFGTSQSAGFSSRSAVTPDARIPAVLNAFVEALQRQDDVAMRTFFPTMTARDARILEQLRKRLGPAADLTLRDLHVRPVDVDEVAEDFVIVANQPNGRELRLPFAAVMHRQNDDWKIVELH
ncbi:MAG TPA: hypothetical protein VF021_01260 [Longimicrobiales bacterium]